MQYEVQYSEEDMFMFQPSLGVGKMRGYIEPKPEVGYFLVRKDGMYDIVQSIYFEHDNTWEVYLRPLEVQIKDGDIIVVANKERCYKFYKRENDQGFKRINLATLINVVEQLQRHVDRLVTISNE
jgi:hypothetical protein